MLFYFTLALIVAAGLAIGDTAGRVARLRDETKRRDQQEANAAERGRWPSWD